MKRKTTTLGFSSVKYALLHLGFSKLLEFRMKKNRPSRLILKCRILGISRPELMPRRRLATLSMVFHLRSRPEWLFNWRETLILKLRMLITLTRTIVCSRRFWRLRKSLVNSRGSHGRAEILKTHKSSMVSDVSLRDSMIDTVRSLKSELQAAKNTRWMSKNWPPSWCFNNQRRKPESLERSLNMERRRNLLISILSHVTQRHGRTREKYRRL